MTGALTFHEEDDSHEHAHRARAATRRRDATGRERPPPWQRALAGSDARRSA